MRQRTRENCAGPFVRPHPVVWRGVLAISVLYEMFLVYLLFQNVDDARQLFKHINPSLGVPLPEKSYAENCSFDFETVWEGVDVFVVAHAVGWWAKALILRDFWMTWIISIMFEVMEYSLEHHLPNFAEVRFFFTNGIIIFFFTLSKKKKSAGGITGYWMCLFATALESGLASRHCTT